MRGKTRRTIAACWLVVSLGLASATALGQARTLYYSGFEPGQDYDAEYTLIGQDGWQGEGPDLSLIHISEPTRPY